MRSHMKNYCEQGSIRGRTPVHGRSILPLLLFAASILPMVAVQDVSSQTVEVREVTVKKNRPDDVFHRAASQVSL